MAGDRRPERVGARRVGGRRVGVRQGRRRTGRGAGLVTTWDLVERQNHPGVAGNNKFQGGCRRMMRGLKRWSGQAQAHTAGRRGLTGPRRRWTTVAALAVAAALLALMGGAATAWAQADPIKIGVIHDGSGPLRTYGQQQVRGLKLGIEYATGGTFAVLGRPIQLIIEDDASDPQRAVQAVRK